MSRLLTLTCAIFFVAIFNLAGIASTAASGSGEHAHKAGQAKHKADQNKGVPDHKPLDQPLQLILLDMDPEKGKALFISKLCITCHSINGVGGEDAPQIDAHVMEPTMNIFNFAARMWNHTQGMVSAQIGALGEQIELTGAEIAHITAFVHDDTVQHTMKESDLPHQVREKMHHDH